MMKMMNGFVVVFCVALLALPATAGTPTTEDVATCLAGLFTEGSRVAGGLTHNNLASLSFSGCLATNSELMRQSTKCAKLVTSDEEGAADCASCCSATQSLRQHYFLLTSPQLAGYRQCFCPPLALNSETNLTHRPADITNITYGIDTCVDSTVVVGEYNLTCVPLLSGGTCGTGCVRIGNCCRPPPPPPEEPGDSIVWLIIISFVAAVVAFELIYHFVQLIRRIRMDHAKSEEMKKPVGGLRTTAESSNMSDALMMGIRLNRVAIPPPAASDVEGGDGIPLFTQEPVTCPICLDDIGISEEVAELQCGHQLHPRCLRTLMAHRIRRFADLTCPVCAKPFLGAGSAELVVPAASPIPDPKLDPNL